MLEVQELAIPEIKLLTPKRFHDARGFFSETFNARRFAEAGVDVTFVQDNHAFSDTPGTVRGLHFQSPPHAQGKLVRAVRGAIYDVAVDVRQGSPTYGKWVSATLSAENWAALWIPAGFAHGLCTLEPDTLVWYKVTDYYAPAQDCGVIWNDPELGIDWPITPDKALVSEKDAVLPTLADLPAYFHHAKP
jgi:dTDP-4-dehydrorhamnose 3,5-epimerase